MMKHCPNCGQTKQLEEFPRNKNSKDGRHAYCKPCHNARGKETYQRLYGGTRHYHLKRRYGIGADDFDSMVAEQGDDIDALLAAATYLATTSSEHRELRDLAALRAGELAGSAV